MASTPSTARTIGGIVVGYLIFAAAAVLIFAFGGGYIAARVARRADNLAGIAVGSIIALGALVSLASSPTGAIWSQLAALLLMAPAAVVGGLVARQRGSRLQV